MKLRSLMLLSITNSRSLKFKFLVLLFIIPGVCFTSLAQSTIFDFKTSVTGFNTGNFIKNIHVKRHVVNSVIPGNRYAGHSGFGGAKEDVKMVNVKMSPVAPTITSFTPLSGTIGSSVTITGDYFNTTLSANTVYFGAVKAHIVSGSATSLTVTVPAGAAAGPISVLSGNGLAAFSKESYRPVFSPTKTTFGESDLAPVQALTSGGYKVSALGDLDGDGKLDIVSVNPMYNTIGIFQNTSTPGSIPTEFPAVKTFSGGSDIEDVIVADFNGDGKLDIAMADKMNNSVSILQNVSTGIGNFNFAAVGYFATGNEPLKLAAADFNEDGLLDIVTVSESANMLTVLYNNGNGNFGSNTDLALDPGAGSRGLAIADLDNDGHADIVSLNYTANNISIFRNNSPNNGFEPLQNFSVETGPEGIAIEDIDGDGKMDIAIAYYSSGNSGVNTLFNTSTTPGTFNFVSGFNVSFGSNARSITFGDLNGDGKPDLIISNQSLIYAAVNNFTPGNFYDSNFGPPARSSLNGIAKQPIVGDLDGDGRFDILSSGDGLDVLRNTLRFTPIISGISPVKASPASSLTISGTDFNTTAGNNIVYFGAVKAVVTGVTGSTSLTVTVPVGAGFGPISVMNAAYNTIAYSPQFFQPEFTGKTGFIQTDLAPKVDFVTGANPSTVVSGDINGDGIPDLIVLNKDGNSFSVFPNTSTTGQINVSSLAAKVDVSLSVPASTIAVGDINGDGKIDVITGATAGSPTAVTIFFNSSTSVISFSNSIMENYAIVEGYRHITIADMDGDGKLDIICMAPSGGEGRIIRNGGRPGGVMAVPGDGSSTFAFSSSASETAIADVDGDGKPDIIMSDYNDGTGNTVSVLRSTSTPGSLLFETAIQYTTGTGPYSVKLGDFDGDGKLDIVTANYANGTGNTVSVLRNTGTGFAPFTSFTTGSQPKSIVIADINGDGKADIATANAGSNNISVLNNTTVGSSITFDAKVDFTTGTSPVSLLAIDLDGDEKPDLVTANSTDNKISILKNIVFPLPAITSFTPSSSPSGMTVTITGTGFKGATAVSFGGTAATSFSVVSANSITAVVAAGVSGDVVIITPGGTGTKAGFTFLSSDANLSAITLSSGTLNTAFAAAILSYSTTVPYASSSIAVSPTVEQANATVKVNGTTVSGASAVTVPLNVGPNTVTTIVTAQDGTSVKTYTIIVTRTAAATNANLSNLVISAGTFTPAFSSATMSYTLFVNNSVNTTTVTPTLDNANATVKVNSTTVRNQAASGNISLAVGLNTITVLVTAEDATTAKTFTIKITRVDPDQVFADTGGNVTVSNNTPEVVVTSPTQAITVTVPVGTTTTPTVVYGSLISGGTGTVPQTTINSPLAKVEIPASTTITGSGTAWDGTLSAPKISNYTFPAIKGQIITKGLVIEVGSPDFSLTFTKAVRLVLYGQAGMRIARIHGGVYTEITTLGTADTQTAGDALAADQSFKINVGADLVIWTKGFSQFITFSQTTDLDVAVTAADLDAITASSITGTNANLTTVTAPLVLPTTGSGSTITWVSDKPAIVSNDGKTINRPVFGSGNATVILTVTTIKGSASETKTFTIVVAELPNQAPTLAVVPNQTLCFTTSTQTIVLSGITAGPESGQLTTLGLATSNPDLLNGLAVNSATGMITYIPINGEGGTTTITVTVKDNGGTANGGTDTFARTFTITINPLPVVKINSDLGTNISKGLTAQLTASGGTSYSWSTTSGIISGQQTATLNVRPAVTTTYTVTATNSSGCTSTQSITLIVAEDYKALDIPNILSPNGDGKNDKLVIKNLDMYPNNTLKIFDRSGRLVYIKQNYTNDWDGNAKGSPLVEETYYYVIDFGAGLGQLKGYVSIVR